MDSMLDLIFYVTPHASPPMSHAPNLSASPNLTAFGKPSPEGIYIYYFLGKN